MVENGGESTASRIALRYRKREGNEAGQSYFRSTRGSGKFGLGLRERAALRL